MKLTDRIAASVKAFSGDAPAPAPIETKASMGQTVAMISRAGTEQWAPIEYRALVRRHRTNPIVRQATRLIGDAVSSIRPTARLGGKPNDRAQAAIDRILARPNPQQDRIGLVKSLASWYVLNGNAFLEAARGLPGYAEFYALRPDLFTITPGDKGFPASYTYRPQSGRHKRWDVDIQNGKAPILHIRDFSADDDLWGHGALEAAQLPLEIYDHANILARAMFRNGAVPSGALVYDPTVSAGQGRPPLTEEMYQRLKQQMEERFSGSKNAGRPMLLDGGLDWKQFGLNMVDLQALELKRDASREVALAFGVPPMLLGIPGDNTYSNYQEASRAFYRQTALPMAETIYGAIGRWWTAAAGAGLSGVDGIELYCDPEQLWALSEELAMKWGRVMGSLVHTTNEKRESIGLQPVKDGSGAGDVVLISSALVPLANVVEPPPMPGDYVDGMGGGVGGGGPPKPDRRADGDGDGKVSEGTGGVV